MAAAPGGGGPGGPPAPPLCVALVQLDVADAAPARNVERAGALIAEAPAADLYLLPELWTTGYATAGWPEAADRHTPGAVAEMQRWAARRRGWVAGSLLSRRDDGALVNRLWIAGPPGADGDAPLAWYDKAHLFAPMAEPDHLAPGTRRAAVTIAGVRAAPSVCFDLRFPEMYRLDALDGAELFLVASAWPAARAEALRLFARARAAENQAALVLCNRTGIGADGTRFGGGSCVVGPDGSVLADAGTRETVLFVELDAAAAGRARAGFPVLPLRIPGVDTPGAPDREAVPA